MILSVTKNGAAISRGNSQCKLNRIRLLLDFFSLCLDRRANKFSYAKIERADVAKSRYTLDVIPILTNPLVEEFRTLEEQCLRLAVAGHFESLVNLLDPRFTAISFHGTTYTYATYVEILRRSTRYLSATLGHIDVTSEGSVVIVSGKMTVDIQRDGVKLVGPIRFTRIWVTRSVGWRVLHMHVSDARVGEAWSNAVNKSKA